MKKIFFQKDVQLKLSPSCENKDDSYSAAFLPVVSDARVAIPSHYKRFSVKMFTFVRDEEVLSDQVRTTANASSLQDCCMYAFKTLSRFMSTVLL